MWKPVYEYEGVYEVDDSGNIKRIAAARGAKPGRILKQTNHNHGYLSVVLSNKNKKKSCLVHRIVYEAFFGPIPDNKEINHKDGNKKNNNINNLDCVTSTENNNHAVDIGLVNNTGENNPMAKLTEDKVKKIKLLYKPREYGYKRIAKDVGVTWECVRDIVKGYTWKHITI